MTAHSESVSPVVAEEDIHAYVDGMLDAAERSRVEAYLAAHPQEAARVQAYRQQNIGLHVLYDAVRREPLPESIAEIATRFQQAMRRQKRNRVTALLAASVCAVAITGSLVWGSLGEQSLQESTSIAANDVSGDMGFLPPFDRISGGNDAATLKTLAEHYAGAPMKAPDLEAIGFKLMVQRVFPTAGGPGAQLLYQNQNGDWIALNIGGDQRKAKTEITLVKHNDVSMFYWRRGALTYGLSGGLQIKELNKVARMVSNQLNLPGRPGTETRSVEAAAPMMRPLDTPPLTVEQRQAEVQIQPKPGEGPVVTPVAEEAAPVPAAPPEHIQELGPAETPAQTKVPENT